jgi:hypothetical protein
VKFFESTGGVQVTSGKLVVDELIAQQDAWSPLNAASGLAGKNVLIVVATNGGGVDSGVVQSLGGTLRATARFRQVVIDSDHDFSDHRVALTRAVLAWVRDLP